MNYPRIIIAGTHSGVGKTTLTLGLISALRKKGINAQSFKTGPDYIDPSFHAEVSGRACGNLDTWLLPKGAVIELFKRRAKDSDISVIEGVMGLYDGLKDNEQGSTAHLAKILDCPVILILDARSLSRSAGAIALGYKEFDKRVNIAGVILNNIASANHYNYIKAAIEKKTKIPILGCLPKDPDLKLPERHLGLIPLGEKRPDADFHKRLSRFICNNIDLSRILKISRDAKPLPFYKEKIFTPRLLEKGCAVIAVARDEAFNFYYEDNLDILRHLGAKIITFSPLRDTELPDGINGLYIGGGFPEIFASDLSKNKGLRESVYKKAKEGTPIYAECGGLMYLMESLIDFKNRKSKMAGVFKGTAAMGRHLRGLGYVNLRCINNNILTGQKEENKAHVFHWSSLTGLSKNTRFAYEIKKNGEIFYDGLIEKNVLAGYAHLHFASNIKIAKNFIKKCSEKE